MSDKNCKGLASVQCCNFNTRKCKYRSDEDECYNPEVIKEALEKEMSRHSEPKRSPDSNGVLPLTEKELHEFKNKFLFWMDERMLFNGITTKGVKAGLSVIYNYPENRNKKNYTWQITNYKAIVYLAERFNLKGDNNE